MSARKYILVLAALAATPQISIAGNPPQFIVARTPAYRVPAIHASEHGLNSRISSLESEIEWLKSTRNAAVQKSGKRPFETCQCGQQPGVIFGMEVSFLRLQPV